MQVDNALLPNPEKDPLIASPTLDTAIANAVKELLCIADIMVVLGEHESGDDGTVPGAWMVWLGNCVLNATEELHSASRAMDRNAKPI